MSASKCLHHRGGCFRVVGLGINLKQILYHVLSGTCSILALPCRSQTRKNSTLPSSFIFPLNGLNDNEIQLSCAIFENPIHNEVFVFQVL